MTPPGLVALLITVVLGAILAFPAFGWSVSGVPRPAAALASVWLLLNFFVWMVPKWRTHIVTTRGPLLGFGFAFAGALVSSIVDGFAVGAASAFGLFVWRGFVLSLPFALALARRLKPYPHWSDLTVLVFAWLLPLVPGFGGNWFAMEGAASAGIFGIGGSGDALTLGPGRLLGLAMISTYFYGARAWTAAPLDWMLREKDIKAAAWMTLSGTAFALIVHLFTGAISAAAPVRLLESPTGAAALAFALFGITLAPAAEELTFRGLIQSGIPKLTRRPIARKRYFAIVTAVFVAALHAAAGAFGLSTGAAFGLSLGICLVYSGVNRLLPAIIAHGTAFAILALLSVWL